eukprot:2884538-Rhodomonas_salina.2
MQALGLWRGEGETRMTLREGKDRAGREGGTLASAGRDLELEGLRCGPAERINWHTMVAVLTPNFSVPIIFNGAEWQVSDAAL